MSFWGHKSRCTWNGGTYARECEWGRGGNASFGAGHFLQRRLYLSKQRISVTQLILSCQFYSFVFIGLFDPVKQMSELCVLKKTKTNQNSVLKKKVL